MSNLAWQEEKEKKGHLIFFQYTVKTELPFWECFTYFGCKTKTGVARILVIFQDRPMFSHIIEKVSVRAFH